MTSFNQKLFWSLHCAVFFSGYWRLHIQSRFSLNVRRKGKIIWSLLSFRMTDQPSHNEDNFIPETITIINCVLNAPLMLISILGNALVLAAIIRTPSIRSTPHMIMLCSLAVSDFLVGLIAQPLYIARELTKDPFVNNVLTTVAFPYVVSLS